MLREYSPEGQLLREISLEPDIGQRINELTVLYSMRSFGEMIRPRLRSWSMASRWPKLPTSVDFVALVAQFCIATKDC